MSGPFRRSNFIPENTGQYNTYNTQSTNGQQGIPDVLAVVRVQLQYSSVQHGECRSCFLRPWVDRVVGSSLGCGSNVSHLSLRAQMHISNILLQNMCSACVLVRHVYMISTSGVTFPSSSSAVFGPKLGTRAMVQCRFSWGYVHVLRFDLES